MTCDHLNKYRSTKNCTSGQTGQTFQGLLLQAGAQQILHEKSKFSYFILYWDFQV